LFAKITFVRTLLDKSDAKQGPAATEILKLLTPFLIKKFLIVSG
jgi:hypothetical protein